VTAVSVSVGSLLLIGTWVFVRRVKKGSWNTSLRLVQIMSAGMVLLFGGAALGSRMLAYAYGLRPAPEEVEEGLFPGITYLRDVRDDPRPLVIHVVRVELGTPGIGFMVTPGDPGEDRPFRAQRTSDFLDEYGLQVAINGDFFQPARDVSPLDFYPHAGDRVGLNGNSSSQGVFIETNLHAYYQTLYLSPTGVATFDEPGRIYDAISGGFIFVDEGRLGEVRQRPYVTQPQPRTAVALDEREQTMLLVVVDGRQPNYSEGVSIAELADIVIEYGGYMALNMDGGGSTTLVVEGADGRPEILNSPVNHHIPGQERPVGNHLGIYARGD
jgi:hypothetical protein